MCQRVDSNGTTSGTSIHTSNKVYSLYEIIIIIIIIFLPSFPSFCAFVKSMPLPMQTALSESSRSAQNVALQEYWRHTIVGYYTLRNYITLIMGINYSCLRVQCSAFRDCEPCQHITMSDSPISTASNEHNYHSCRSDVKFLNVCMTRFQFNEQMLLHSSQEPPLTELVS